MDTSTFPQLLHRKILSELQPRERITWMGQPIAKRSALMALPVVICGIIWTWPLGGMAWTAFNSGYPRSLFGLLVLPFIGFGLVMLSMPYWAHRIAKNSAYVLTDQRAIIFRSDWRDRLTVLSFTPEKLGDLHVKRYADGSGNLLFERSKGDHGRLAVGFLACPEIEQVETMINALALGNRV